ncbi:MAG: DUF1080 domain-containing protein [Armatimonadota bacterium]
MVRGIKRAAVCSTLVLCCLQFACAQHGSGSPPDAFMGDWHGTLQAADGTETQICAQVISWGRGQYQANLLEAFDQRIEPIAVLKGQLRDGEVVFGDSARIAEGGFTGQLPGQPGGTFRMKHVVRLSPTLGAAPPPGAVVLFDGTSLDEWDKRRRSPWILNLGRLVGGTDRAVYLRCRLWCPAAQPGLLEFSSDDAAKVWWNDEVVHTGEASQPLRPWRDKADIELSEGWNVLMLKVVQGGGGWAACARVRAPDGKDIEGLRFEPAPALAEGTNLKTLQGDSSGTIVTWQLAGPYSEEGVKGLALLDVSFAPEKGDDAEVEWRTVNDNPPAAREWKLVEGGAMEITPGAGPIVSKRQFQDHKVHLEFRTPFRPTARGQGRGNSGVYVQRRYEIQVLDSYGLKGKSNECGGIYGRAAPLVNMCAPPLQWQTFDIEFRAARLDEDGKKAADARITVYHNGVLIHDDVRLPSRSPGTPGGLLLQDHGNPVQYRNIWVVELPPE